MDHPTPIIYKVDLALSDKQKRAEEVARCRRPVTDDLVSALQKRYGPNFQYISKRRKSNDDTHGLSETS